MAVAKRFGHNVSSSDTDAPRQTLDKMLQFLHRADVKYPTVAEGRTLVDRMQDKSYFTSDARIRELLFKSGLIDEPADADFDLGETVQSLSAATFFKTVGGWVAKTLVAKEDGGQLHWYSTSLVSVVDCKSDGEPRDEWDEALASLVSVLPQGMAPTLHFPLVCPGKVSPDNTYDGVDQGEVCMLLLMAYIYDTDFKVDNTTVKQLRRKLSVHGLVRPVEMQACLRCGTRVGENVIRFVYVQG